jgi:hypothetical protein
VEKDFPCFLIVDWNVSIAIWEFAENVPLGSTKLQQHRPTMKISRRQDGDAIFAKGKGKAIM